MTEEPETHELSTLEDVALLFARLPEDRGEILLKEMSDAMRIIGPVAAATKALGGRLDFLPVRWINDTKGKASVNLKTEDDSFSAAFKFDLPKSEQT